MGFLDISLLSTTYRFVVKIAQNFKQKKRDFGSMNMNPRKGAPKPPNKGQGQGRMPHDNFLKLQVKNNTMKTKKDTRKWCEFYKSPTHNTSECWAKKSPVDKRKDSKLDACSESELETDKGNDRGKKIIDAEPSATISTTKI